METLKQEIHFLNKTLLREDRSHEAALGPIGHGVTLSKMNRKR